MNGDMGVLLTMEPNYEDFSCQVGLENQICTFIKGFTPKQLGASWNLATPYKLFVDTTLCLCLVWTPVFDMFLLALVNCIYFNLSAV